MAVKNTKNRGIDATLKELNTVRAKEIEYQEKEEKLKADLNAFINNTLHKKALESAGSEEALVQLIKNLDSGEIVMTFSEINKVTSEGSMSGNETETLFSDDTDKFSEYGEG